MAGGTGTTRLSTLFVTKLLLLLIAAVVPLMLGLPIVKGVVVLPPWVMVIAPPPLAPSATTLTRVPWALAKLPVALNKVGVTILIEPPIPPVILRAEM